MCGLETEGWIGRVVCTVCDIPNKKREKQNAI